MTRFWWVRHGPTHARGMVGWTDLPADLSDAATIDWLNAYLPDDAVIVASDLVRASATADAISPGRERLADRHGLREIHFGDWEGLVWRDIDARDPETARRYWTEPGTVAAPGGESWNTAATRVEAEVAELSDAYAGRDIVVVAHFGAILTQVQRAARLSPAGALQHRIENLSVTRIDGTGQDRRVIEISTLPPPGDLS